LLDCFKYIKIILPKIQNVQESFTNFIITNRKDFDCINYLNEENLSSNRWTVDYEEDFEFVKKIYTNLYDPQKIFHMQDILEYLSSNPNIRKINQKYTKS